MMRRLVSDAAPYSPGSPKIAVGMQQVSELDNVSGTGTIEQIMDGPATDYPLEMAGYPNAIRFTTTDGALFRKRNILTTAITPWHGCLTHWLRIPPGQDYSEVDRNQIFAWQDPEFGSGNYSFSIPTDANWFGAFGSRWIPYTFSIAAAAESGAPNYPPDAPLGAFYTGLNSVGSNIPNTRLDIGPIFANVRQRCKVMITFEGCDDSIYLDAFPKMEAQGFVGTVYVIDSEIGGAGKMTLPQIEELSAAGWSIGMSLALEQSNYSDSELATEVARIRSYATGQGWNRKHISWHGNPYRAAAVDLVLNDDSLKTARLKEVNAGAWDPITNLNLPFLPADDMDETAAGLLGDIDAGIEQGFCRVLWGFGTSAGGGSDFMAEAEFTSLLASLKSRQRQGLCDVLSMEGYERASLGLRAAA